ncbi:MAG: septal ring lytic transglycosylase RlpA family protein [Candidatus Coatesbacteria bacterium]|nr:septal ring lytic transglycosylase RlpA family protein [Candidatus Coatesbacteria bacterium]
MRNRIPTVVIVVALLTSLTLTAGCYRRRPENGGVDQVGRASWYGDAFQGRPTASGEPFDMYAHTAAHRNLPFGTRVRVTNLENGRSVVVRINDRGPWVEGRIIDLAYAAARELGMIEAGVVRVELRLLD